MGNLCSGGCCGCCCCCCSVPARGPSPEGMKHFTPVIKRAVVSQVIDGDTVVLKAKINWLSPEYPWRCRLAGIDCPELRSRNAAEKAVAQQAKAFMEAQVLGRKCRVHVHGLCKFNRLVVDLFHPDSGRSMGDMLKQRRLAIPYDAHKPKSAQRYPRNWEAYRSGHEPLIEMSPLASQPFRREGRLAGRPTRGAGT